MQSLKDSFFQATTLQKRLLQGGIWATGGKFIALFLGIVINALLTRLLSPEEVGAYVLTFSIVNLGAIIGQLGLGRTGVKLIAEAMGRNQEGRARYAISLILKLTIIGSILAAIIIGAGFGQWVAQNLFNSTLISTIIKTAAFWAAIMTVKSIIVEIFRGFHWISASVIFTDLGMRLLLTPVLAVLWFVQNDSTLKQVVLLTLSVTTLVTIIGIILLSKYVSSLPREDLEVRKTLTIQTVFWNSSSIWFSMLLFYVLGNAIVWLLGIYTSSDDVALYNSAFQLVSLVSVPLVVIQAVLPPVIAELHAQQLVSKLESVLQRSAFLSFIPSLLLFIILLVGGRSILPLFYGEFYIAAYPFLIILSLGQLVNAWTGLCGETLFQTGYQNLALLTYLLGTILALVGSFLLVKTYGSFGILGAFTVSTIFMNVLALLLVRNKIGIWTYARINNHKLHW